MKKILDKLEQVISIVCVVLFIIIAVLIAVQVFTRYVLSNTLSWSEQAARGAFIWMLMLYSGVLIRKGGNLGFDILTQKLPPILKHLCGFFAEAIILLFSVYWFYQSFQLCLSFRNFYFAGFKVPYNAIYSAEPVGAILIAVYTAELIVRHIQEIRRKEEAV